MTWTLSPAAKKWLEDDLATKAAVHSQLTQLGYDIADPKTKIWIRLLSAKGLPIEEQKKLGMTFNINGRDIPKGVNGFYYPESGKFVEHKKVYKDGKPELDENGNPKWIEKKCHINGLSYFKALNDKWAVYLIVNPTNGAADADVTKFPVLFYETDGATKEEQWQQLRQLEAKMGRKASLVIETRNSLHIYFLLDKPLTNPEEWTPLQQRLIQKNDSDPAIWNPSRLMRVAGYDHLKWNAETEEIEKYPVTIQQVSDTKFTLEEFNKLLPEWDKERWNEEKKASSREIKTKTNRVKRDRTVEQSALQKELRGFEGRSGNKLVDFLDFEVLPKMTVEQIYNYSGHNFQNYGSTLKGNPPWRSSSSGTSFHVWNDGQRWAWQDKALGCGGGAVQYRWKLKGGEGTPKGKDYVDIVRELASEAGVPFPEFKSVKKPKHKKTEEEIQQEKEQDAAQLTVETNIYNQLTSLDVEKIQELGIKVKLIDKPLLTPEDLNLQKQKITIVISPKATGKTEATAKAVSQFGAIYSWHDRISLARAMAAKISALYKDEADKYRSPKVTFCANSAYQFDPKKLTTNGILIVDEGDQILKYFFDTLCNKDGIRPLILNTHVAHLASALIDGSALYMSADITYKEIAYIKSIAPHNTEIEVVINRHKPVLSEIQFITDKSPEGLVVKLLEALENGIPCFVVDDLKNGVLGCKSIAEYIRKKHPEWADEIKEINADTVGEESMKDFLPNINERSKTVRLIICSPSVTSGVSITNGRFVNGVFGFFNGILSNTSASQALARVRGAKDIYVWAAEKGLTSENSGEITPEEINAYYQNNYDVRNKILATANVEYNPISQEWESPHWDLFCKNAATKNIVMRRLRHWIRQQLISNGYQINDIELGENETVLDYLKQGWGDIQVSEILAIESAVNIDKDEYDRLKEKISSGGTITPDELSSIRKYHLQDTFGERIINDANCEHPSGAKLEGIAAMAYLNWGKGLEASLKRYYRFFNRPLDDAINRDLGAERQQEKVGNRFPGDLRYSSREHKFWESLNFEQFLDPKREWLPGDYKEICDRIRHDRVAVAQVIGTNFEKMSNGQIFTTLLNRLGFDIISERIQVKGNRCYMKKIDAESWELAQKFVGYQEERRLVAEAEAEARCIKTEPVPFIPLIPAQTPAPVTPEPEPQSMQLSIFDVAQQPEHGVATPPVLIVKPDFDGGGGHLGIVPEKVMPEPTFPYPGAKAVTFLNEAVKDHQITVNLTKEFVKGVWQCVTELGKSIYRMAEELAPAD